MVKHTIVKHLSDIPKFKKVEALLRQATLVFIDVVNEIDFTLNTPRSEKETQLLNQLRQQCVEYVGSARKTLSNFYSDIESIYKK